MALVPPPATAIMLGRNICTSRGRNSARATGAHKKPSEHVSTHAGDLSRATGHLRAAEAMRRGGPLANYAESPPCSVAAFVVNLKPHAGARTSVRLCAGLKLLPVTVNPGDKALASKY